MTVDQLRNYIAFLETVEGPSAGLLLLIERKKRDLIDLEARS